ncbi:hypothetical protein [Paracoccus sp. (in: a-proteobacteria)]|uniref:hypothetical protein n=1 Tax=Paracoccus sp. TaxID=267 RepID=UPI0026DFC4A7|nr:hypothetical protein [Paracoccus sp. (in: a-proteobacteria)]MDO5647197.1 hypothetical protein [Paracoccus sp. (in: a-proteobacteria)]
MCATPADFRAASAALALTLAGTGTSSLATETAWPGDGLSLMFAAMARDGQGWMVPPDDLNHYLDNPAGLDCVSAPEGRACTEQTPARIVGIIALRDNSRCVSVWSAKGTPPSHIEAEFLRIFAGAGTDHPDDATLAWTDDIASHIPLMADASALLSLCQRFDRDMAATGKNH